VAQANTDCGATARRTVASARHQRNDRNRFTGN
jgi:hypothetical protein